MSSFEWGDGIVHIKPATGRTRNYFFYLKSLMGVYDMPEGFEKDCITTALFCLSRVDKVEGDIGFHVPNGDATEDNLKAFCDALMDADENLFIEWNGAVMKARAGGNDPSLLPPGDVANGKKKKSK